MFVTSTDFNIPPLVIPNLQGSGPINSFNAYVEREEEKILKSLLGVTLYNSFIEGLDTDYPDEVWLKLRDGDTYIIDGKTYEWVGMKKALVPYIFAMWTRDNYRRQSGVGTVKGKAENATVVNPKFEIATAYNDFSHLVGNCHDKKNTLYGYLSVMGGLGTFDGSFDDSFDTFDQYFDFVFNDPGRMNTMNI
jgi:hypothetical protein